MNVSVYAVCSMIFSAVLCIVSFALIVLFVMFSGICVPEARNAVDLFLSSVLPVMFPFYVLSSVIVSGGFLSRVCAPLKSVTAKLFKLPPECGVAVILGLLCGFPVGAKITCDLKSRGDITADEAARLASFTNSVGPVFMASVIGGTCFGNVRTGLILWLAVSISSLLSGIILCNVNSRERACASCVNIHQYKAVKTDIPASILSSMNTVLYVGAVIIFFASLTSLLNLIPSLNAFAHSLLYSFLEITGGLTRLITDTHVSSLYVKCMLTASFAAWSGCSVHMQVCGILSSEKVSLRYYFIGKIMQSVISPVITLIILLIL